MKPWRRARPSRCPTVAAASAGASLMPSPTIMVGARRRSAATAASFSPGLRSATIEVEAEFGSHARGGSGIIARDHDDPRYAGGAQVLDRLTCVGARRIAEHQDGGQPAVGLQEDRQHRLALKSIDQAALPRPAAVVLRESARATRPGA